MRSILKQTLLELEKAGMLKRISQEVDPNLEMAKIAREAFDNNGPALLFEKVKGSKFQAAANIFGSKERLDFIFKKTLAQTKNAVQFKSNPTSFFKQISPIKLLQAVKAGIHSLPKRSGCITDFEECTLNDLPQIKCWPKDGGAFITLPQVATRTSAHSGIMTTNVGMYRVQISGNNYAPDECGLHYQITRDIAKHHQAALADKQMLKVSVFIGGPLAHTIAAIMPMPENLSELVFAGMLSGKRFRYFIHDDYIVSSDADFCILGEVAPELKPEGPFGDHIGYYSAKHLFPYLKVKKVLCKKDAIFPFTVVGRPPKEDTLFGNFIHEITRPMVPTSIPGVHEIHAVDAAGVHSLCLSLASERFIPYAKSKDREPMELLKTANALLGFNQVSLSKYLFIAAKEDNPALSVSNIPQFFTHILERIHFNRDLHFQTSTTIDTLDYTGTSLNHGSKLVIVAAGEKCRTLRNKIEDLSKLNLPECFFKPQIIMPGVIAIQWEKNNSLLNDSIHNLKAELQKWEFKENYPWISVVDKTSFDKMTLDDFLWMTFTRSDPAQDIYGLNEEFHKKHWSINAPLIVDARMKEGYQEILESESSL